MKRDYKCCIIQCQDKQTIGDKANQVYMLPDWHRCRASGLTKLIEVVVYSCFVRFRFG